MSPSKKRRSVIFCWLLAPLGVCLGLTVFTYFAAGPSPECLFPSESPLQPGITARRLDSGGVKRCYLLYTPPGVDSTQPLPMIIALHGFASNGHGMSAMSAWQPVADRAGFLVVYPDGSSFPLRWNIGAIANIPDIDDVQFVSDMIADVSGRTHIDPARIYITGFSNGGQMAHRVACQLDGQIAALGVVDGIDPGMLEDCAASRPIAVMGFFGTGNPLEGQTYPRWFYRLINVNPDAPQVLTHTAALDWAAGWARRNGCALPEQALPAAGNVRAVRFSGCAADSEVVLYLIEGQGHAWPGGGSLPGLGDDVSNINASETLWDFFQQHQLGEMH